MQATEFLVTNIRGVTVVVFQSPSILDSMEVETIGKRLYPLVDEQARRKIVLDFSQVRFLSSQVLGVLINLHKKAQKINGELIICGLHPELGKVFKITRLDKLLKFAKDEEAALNEFGVSGQT